MNLKHLTDQELLAGTERAVKTEREALLVVLHHLREVERRRLFCALGYSSLFKYAVKQLKYSEWQAQDRVSAMRALKEIPELEEKIDKGSINLSNLCLAQSFFREEAKTRPLQREEKVQVIAQLENLSKREAEKVVLSLSSNPKPIVRETARAVSHDHVEVKMVIPEELEAKLNRLKGLLAHSHPNLSRAELLDKLCDLGLEKWDPLMRNHRKEPGPAQKSRVIRGAMKTKVWGHSNGKCVNCGSEYAVQTDHKIPFAKGGDSSEKNLRPLCRTCNQRAAIEQFGIEKMGQYLK